MNENMIRTRDAIIHKIAWYCDRIGKKEVSEYFNKVKTGEINPFDDWQNIKENAVGLGSGL